VPEGEFLMGAEDSDAADNEQPEHTVYLDAYWIDQTEITNQMYRACVDAGRCNTPSSTSRYDNPEYSNHPVVYVSWDDATTYCQWAGRRLPSEACCTKAARGVLSPRRKEGSRKYPWGDQVPTAQLANFNGNVGDTTEVGSYPTGASPYGAYDMAGNVWEWVNDFYDEDYYADSPRDNPRGSSVEGPRVLRGGSWEDDRRWLRGSARGRGVARFDDGGFRCAASDS
jgi:serine/threonine-protein kinase